MALSRFPRIARLRYLLKEFPGSISLHELTPHDLECVMALDAGVNEHYRHKRNGGGVEYAD